MTVQVTRRTVARGAAWAAPVLAVSVAAPAFAVSGYTKPTVVLAAGNKCPGKGSGPSGNVYYYNERLTLTSPGGSGYSIRVDSITIDGTSVTVQPPQTQSIPSAGGAVVVRWTSDKSANKYNVVINYTILHGATVMSTGTASKNNLEHPVWKTGDFGTCPTA